MSDRRIAYAAVVVERGFAVAIVETDVAGFSIDPREPPFPAWDVAWRRAQEKNMAQGLNTEEAWVVVESSMKTSRKSGTQWKQRGL